MCIGIPQFSCKAFIQNNAIATTFSFSAKEGYDGLGARTDVLAMINQATMGTITGRLSPKLDLNIDKLNIRLNHVNNILPKGSDLSKYLQGGIEALQNRANKISTVTGTGVNYINSEIDKANQKR